jgi:hypothetical protein
MRAQIWPLFPRSACAKSADLTSEVVALASVRLVDVGLASHCVSGHEF